jgi:CRISPR system Cascade subunit CasD
MIAAALGIPRDGSLDEFMDLHFGTRTDAPGTLLDDFQTAISLGPGAVDRMPLTRRHYLQDAVFVAGLSGEIAQLERYRKALRSPAYPLYLGRRSCPPDGPIVTWLVDADLETALREVSWQASDLARERLIKARRGQPVVLPLIVDAGKSDVGGFVETVADQPLSFSPERRRYGARAIRRPRGVTVVGGAVPEHAPFALIDEMEKNA